MTNYNWNATAKHRMNSNVVEIIESFFDDYLAHQPWARDMWPGSGWRTGSMEHNSGRALDGMVVARTGIRPTAAQKAAGDRAVSRLIQDGKRLGLQWILWSRDGEVTWSYNMDRGTWKRLKDRGSISANHVDHWHAYFKSNAKLPTGFTWGPSQATQEDDDEMKLTDVIATSPDGTKITVHMALLRGLWGYDAHLDGGFTSNRLKKLEKPVKDYDGKSIPQNVAAQRGAHAYGALFANGWSGKRYVDLLQRVNHLKSDVDDLRRYS